MTQAGTTYSAFLGRCTRVYVIPKARGNSGTGTERRRDGKPCLRILSPKSKPLEGYFQPQVVTLYRFRSMNWSESSGSLASACPKSIVLSYKNTAPYRSRTPWNSHRRYPCRQI